MELKLWIHIITLFFGAVHGDCPIGWKAFDTSCYLFSYESLTWFEASTSCLSHHGDLVEVEGSEEQLFLENNTKSLGGGFWLGARDDVIEGTWVWSSDSVMTYTNWADGQPDNGHDEDCVEMKDKYSWKWNDNQCDEHRKYICEKMQTDLGGSIIDVSPIIVERI